MSNERYHETFIEIVEPVMAGSEDIESLESWAGIALEDVLPTHREEYSHELEDGTLRFSCQQDESHAEITTIEFGPPNAPYAIIGFDEDNRSVQLECIQPDYLDPEEFLDDFRDLLDLFKYSTYVSLEPEEQLVLDYLEDFISVQDDDALTVNRPIGEYAHIADLVRTLVKKKAPSTVATQSDDYVLPDGRVISLYRSTIWRNGVEVEDSSLAQPRISLYVSNDSDQPIETLHIWGEAQTWHARDGQNVSAAIRENHQFGSGDSSIISVDDANAIELAYNFYEDNRATRDCIYSLQKDVAIWAREVITGTASQE